MTERHIVLLLQLVHAQAPMTALRELDLTYGQIAQIIEEARGRGFIAGEGHDMHLTAAAVDYMRIDPSTKRTREDGGWISPENSSRIAQRPVDEIYLPPKASTFFTGE